MARNSDVVVIVLEINAERITTLGSVSGGRVALSCHQPAAADQAHRMVGVGAVRRRRAVFLDRKGVIVIPEFREGRGFAPLKDYRFYPQAQAASSRLKSAGYLVIVVTN